MNFEQQMHWGAALGLLYLAWEWMRAGKDFLGGQARVEYSFLHRLWDRERVAMIYAREGEPLGFWTISLIKVLLLAGLTFVLVTLLHTQ